MSGTEIFLIVLGVLVLAVLVASAVVVRSRRQLSSAQRTELPTRPTAAPDVQEPAVQEPAELDQARPDQSPTEQVPASDEPSAPVVVTEVPEAPTSRMARLRRRLAGSNNALARGLADLLSRDRIDEETWEDFETTLITSDLGVGPTTELVERLRRDLAVDGVRDSAQANAVLSAALVDLVDPGMDRSLAVDGADGKPAVVLVVGVNGTGKTTTCGKLARVLVAEDRSVLLGAADTFRAAAADQLTTWGERVGVETVRGAEGADPASVAFDAVSRGVDAGVDVVVVDTAGRLHTKTGLMDELGKVKRVIEKVAPVTEVLLVLDATTGQNGLTQARIFAEAVQITGIVLTKLDGSAKGGIVVQVQRELGVPVKLIGLGEGADDLAPFEPKEFVAGLLGQ